MDWSVTRTRHVERYRYVQPRKKKSRKAAASKRGPARKSRDRRRAKSIRRCGYRRPRRVLLEKPLRWTQYRAEAKLGQMFFTIRRDYRTHPYRATLRFAANYSWLGAELPSGTGDTPAAAFNVLCGKLPRWLRKQQRTAAAALVALDDVQ